MQTKQTGESRPAKSRSRLTGLFLLILAGPAFGAIDLDVSLTGPAEYTPGESTTNAYTLVITNAGDSVEGAPDITTAFPAGTTISWTCTANGTSNCGGSGSGTGNLNRSSDTIDPGDTLEYQFDVDFDSGLADDPLTVTATIVDSNDVTSTDSVASTRVLEANLSVDKTAASLTYVPGTSPSAAYSIVVSNAGPSDASGILLEDLAPTDMSIDSWSCQDSGSTPCPTASGTGDISETFTLPSQETFTWTVNASYPSDALTDPLENTATLTIPASLNDPQDADPADGDHVESASTSQPRDPRVNLSAEFTSTATSYTPGGSDTHTVRFANTGPSDARTAKATVTFFADLANDFETIDFTCSPQSQCSVASGTRADFSILENGTDPAEVSLSLDLDLPDGSPVTVQLNTDYNSRALTDLVEIDADIVPASGETETDVPDNNRSTALAKDRRAEISIVKTATVAETAPNAEFEYLLEITNLGPSDVGHDSSAPDSVLVNDLMSADLNGQASVCPNGDGSQPCWSYCASDGGDASQPVGPDSSCPTEVLTGQGDLVDVPLSIAAGNSSTVKIYVSTSPSAGDVINNTATVGFPEPGPVTEIGPTDDNSNSASLDVIVGGDITVSKTDGTTTAVPGEPHSYTVVVANEGFIGVNDVRVLDAMPIHGASLDAGFTSGSISFQCEAFDGACCNHNSNQCGDAGTPTPPETTDTVDRNVDLPAGSRVEFTITGDLHPEAFGSLNNTASIELPTNYEDPAPDNNSAGDSNTQLVPEADLVIGKELLRLEPKDGPPFTLTYQIDVTNNGPSQVDDAVVQDLLDDTRLETGSASWYCEVTNASGGTECLTTTSTTPATGMSSVVEEVILGPGGSVRLIVTVATKSNDVEGEVENTASVTSSAGSDSVTISSGLTGSADLVISKTSNRSDIAPGTEIEYLVTVENLGPDNVFGATVTDTFPPQIENVAWTCEATTPVPGDLNFQNNHGSAGTQGRKAVTSADGQHVYVIDGNGQLFVFDRDATPGLTFGRIAPLETEIQGINDSGDIGGTVSGLAAPIDIVIAPDGRHVYVLSAGTADTDPAVATFERNVNAADQANFGTLTFVDRVTEGIPQSPRRMAMTDEHIYVSGEEVLSISARDPALGIPVHDIDRSSELPSAPGPMAIDPAGPYLFVASSNSTGVHAFAIEPAGGGNPAGRLTLLDNLGAADSDRIVDLELAPDAPQLYAAASGSSRLLMIDYAQLESDPMTVGFNYDEAAVGVAGLLDATARIDLAADGEHLLLTNETIGALARLRRDPISGGLTAEALTNHGDPGHSSLAHASNLLITPDGRHVLIVLAGSDAGTIARYSRLAPDPLFAFIEKDSQGDPDADGAPIAAMQAPNDIVVSPDGDHVYTVSLPNDSIVAFRRDPSKGTTDDTLGLHLEAFDDYVHGRDGVAGLLDARRILISGDGASVFVTSESQNSLAVFDRNTDDQDPAYGTLTFRAVFTDGQNGVEGLSGAQGMAIDSTGNHLYVAGRFDSAIAIFDRDPGTGAVTWREQILNGEQGVSGLQNIRDLAMAPDDAQLLGVSTGDNALVVFNRDNVISSQNFGALSFVEARKNGIGQRPVSLAIPGSSASGSGEHVYVAGQNSHSIAVLRRVTDPASSAFGQVQPIEVLRNGDSGVSSLSGPRDIIVSPDGKRVYVASENRGAILVLDRDLNASSESFGRLNAVEVRTNNVAGVSGIDQVRGLAISRSSRNVYAAGFGSESVASFLLGTGSLCSAGGGGDINDRVDIGAGGTLQYRARGTVRADATGELVNMAGVAVPERFEETVPADNTAEDRIDLIPQADLALDKSTEDVSVTAGEHANFDITITNPGPSNLVHEAGMPLTLTDALDTNQFDAANASWSCQASGSGALDFLSAYEQATEGGPAGFDAMRGITTLTRFEVAGSLPAVAAVSVIDNAVLIFPQDPFNGALNAPTIINNGDNLPGGTVNTLTGAGSIAVSADGRFLYVASRIDDAVTVFELFDNGGSIEADLVAAYDGLIGLDQAIHLILGPNDEQLYVAGVNDDAIAVFERDSATGSLSFVESEQNGVNDDGAAVMGLTDVEHLAVSPDGTYVYALSGSTGQIAVFARNATDGTLAWQDHFDSIDLGVSIDGASSAVFDADGAYLYLAASAVDRIVVLQVATNGNLSLASSVSQADGGISGLSGVGELLLTNDGNHLYATSPVADSVVWFVRNGADGSLSYGGVRANSSSLVDGLEGATGMAFDPSLDQLYVAATQQPAVSRFKRQADSFCPASGTGPIDAVPFNIAAGGTIRFQLDVDVLAGVDGQVSNTAVLDAARDTDPANNTDTQTSPISQQADVSITKDDGLREFDALLDAAAITGTARNIYVAGQGDAGIAILDRNDATGDPDFGRLTFRNALLDGDAGLSGLNGISDLTLDGSAETLYATASGDNSVVVFNRLADGQLQPAQLLQNGTGGVSGISGARSIEITADDAHAYVVGGFSNAIVAMTRIDNPGGDDHGQLTYLQTLENGVNGVLGIAQPVATAVSPDGKHVYVLGREDDTLAVFERNANPGSANFGRLIYLTHYINNVDDVVGLGGVRDIALSNDGAYVYVLGDADGTLAVFERDPTSGELTCVPNTESTETACFFRQDGFGDTVGLTNARSIHLDHLAGELYVAGDGAVSRFTLDADDGTPAFADQIVNGEAAPLTGGEVFGLENTADLVIPADGGQLYAASTGSNSVITLQRGLDAPGSLDFADIIIDGLGGIAPGEDVVYTIVVENHGPSDVAQAEVVDQFPEQFENVAWTCTSANGALCPASGEGDLSTNVSLPVGGRVTFSAGGRIKDDATGRLSNTASVSVGGILDPVLGNNEATDDDTVLAPAMDVFVDIDNGATQVTPGLSTSYEVRIANLGPSYSSGIRIRDVIPAALYDTAWSCLPQPRAGVLESPASATPSLTEHRDIVFSSNGRHAYAAGLDGGIDAVSFYQRDAISGTLVQKQTLIQGSDGVAGLQGVSQLALSPDGRFLYAAAPAADSIARFDRDTTTGELSFADFIQDGDPGAEALGGVSNLLPSPDGAWLYALSGTAQALSTFAIDPVDGSLTQVDVLRNGDALPEEEFLLDGLNGASDMTWSSDGSHLLVSARQNQSLTAFTVNSFSGELAWATDARADGSGLLGDPIALAVSANGDVFVASPGNDRVDRFRFETDLAESGPRLVFGETLDAGSLDLGALEAPSALAYDPDRRRLYIQHQGTVAMVSLMRQAPEVVSEYSAATYPVLAGVAGLSIGPGERHLYTLGTDLTAWPRKRGSRCSVSGTGGLSLQEADITAGGAVTYIVNGRVQANAIGTIDYTVEAGSPLPEQELNPSDNLATDGDALGPRPDLSLTKSATPNPVVAGESILFKLETQNAGPSDALQASLADEPPIFPQAGGLLAGSGQWACQANAPLGTPQPWSLPESISGLAVGAQGVYAASANADAVIVLPRTGPSLDTPRVIHNGDTIAGGTVVGLDGANSVAISSDERHLYVTGKNENSLVVFARESAGDSFQFLERHESGVNGVFGMINPISVDVSQDGANVYVIGDAPPLSGRPSVVVFARNDESGALEYLEREADGIGSISPESNVLDGVRATWLTRDGNDLYTVATDSDALSRFSRSGEDGTLEFENVWRDGDTLADLTVTIADPIHLAAGPADEHLYVLGAKGIAQFARHSDGSLDYQRAWVDIPELGTPRALHVDPAGTRLYLLDDAAIHVFARDWNNGDLSHRNRVELNGGMLLFGESNRQTLWASDGDRLLAYPELALSRCLQTAGTGNTMDFDIEMGSGGYSDTDYSATVHPSSRGSLVNIASIFPANGVDPDATDNASESVTEIDVVSDLAIVKSGPAEAVAGETITYQLVVTNQGPSSALGIGIDDFTNPAGALLEPEWRCTVVDNGGIGQSSCPATSDGTNFSADLMVGDELIIDVVATIDPAVVGPLLNTAELIPEPDSSDPTPDDHASSVTTEVKAIADVSISKSLAGGDPVAGEVVAWDLVVNNAGPSDAPQVLVTDVLDPRLGSTQWTCQGFDGAGCPSANGNGDLDLTVDLPAGGRIELTASGLLPSSASGLLPNAADNAVQAPATDPEPGNDSAATEHSIAIRPDLALEIAAPLNPFDPDGSTAALPLTVTARNLGPSDASNAVVDFGFDADVSVSASGCSRTDDTWSCNAGSLTSGESVSWSLQIYDLPSAGEQLLMDAVLVTSENDPQLANNQASQTISLVNGPDVQVTIDNAHDTVDLGSSVRYEISVSNIGSVSAANVDVLAPISDDLIDAVWTCSADGNASCSATGSGDITDVITLGAGETATYLLDVRVDPDLVPDPGPSHMIIQTISSSLAGNDDINTGNNADEDRDTLKIVLFRDRFEAAFRNGDSQ